MNIQRLASTCVAILLTMTVLALSPESSRAQIEPSEDPSDVFVEVDYGFNVRMTAAGWIGFVTREPRSDLIHANVDPDLAFDTIDSLLAIGFLWMQDSYPSSRDRLWAAPDGRIQMD